MIKKLLLLSFVATLLLGVYKITKAELPAPKSELTVPNDSLDISFINKTTRELDVMNFHNCFGMLLDDSKNPDKYAVAQFSLNTDACQKGKSKIVFEEFVEHYDNGKANFVIKDELTVTSNYPKKCYSVKQATLKGQAKSYYLLEFQDNNSEKLKTGSVK